MDERNDAPPPKPTDPWLLPDDTPCIEGHHADGTPFRVIEWKPAVPAAAPELPVTPAELRARIEVVSGRWIHYAPGDATYTTWAQPDIVEWWADADRIRRPLENAPPVPAMPAPFPGRSVDPNEGLHAACIMLEWLGKLEAPPKSDESPAVPVLLASWREILIALGLHDNKEDKGKLSRLNKTYAGPITIPGQGRQPLVEKAKLLEWYQGLAAKVQAKQDRQRDAQATVSARHDYGREGEVAPDLAGGVKKRRHRKP